MTELNVGIDLGGSNIAVVIVDPEGTVVARAKMPTERGLRVAAMAERMREVVDLALDKIGTGWEQVSQVGVAVPSSVEPQSGILVHAPNLGWKNEPVRDLFKEVFGPGTVIGNDANCGMIGEFWAGAARNTESAVGFFVGTGLGGGIIINGHLITGMKGVAGELGHQIVRYKGRRCGCGNNGCVEAYCSKAAFAKRLQKLIKVRGKKSMLSQYTGDDFATLRSKHLKKCYQAEDKVVCKVVDQGARMLGVAVANMMAVLAPECVILGGGVMEALGEELLPVVRQGMADHLFGLLPDDARLRLSQLGDDAVPLGASRLGDFLSNK